VTKRIFIAVDPPAQGKLAAGILRAQTGEHFSELRLVKPGQHHITLAFLGATDEAITGKVYAATESVSRRHTALNAMLDGWLGFPSLPLCRAISLAVSSDPLAALADDLRTELAGRNISLDHKPLSLHLTIARVKGGKPLNLEHLSRAKTPSFPTYRIDSVRIYESIPTDQGFEHQTLKVFKLKS